MARSALPQSPSAIAATNLARLLTRLDQRINAYLTSGAAPPFEREKLLANLDYARRIHLQLKKGLSQDTNGSGTSPASSVVIGHAAKVFRGKGRDEKIREDLVRWEGWIRELVVKAEGVKAEEVVIEEEKPVVEEKEAIPEPEPEPEKVEEKPVETKTYASVTASTEFNEKKPYPTPQPTAPAPPTVRNRFERASTKTEAINTEEQIDIHRKEQEDITDDLLRMAKLLKESSVAFGQDLENEKPYLEMAQSGLDKNMDGMGQTGQKMDHLRKDQTVGFIRTIINIVMIVALVFLIMLVLSMPKLRR